MTCNQMELPLPALSTTPKSAKADVKLINLKGFLKKIIFAVNQKVLVEICCQGSLTPPSSLGVHIPPFAYRNRQKLEYA